MQGTLLYCIVGAYKGDRGRFTVFGKVYPSEH